ncbi:MULTISPECIES: GvpL/GvpF family gas vesicle protein [unclassified Kitasatospora]|uniref:GvpL/GvpF family gas vesicle protein n=1 Tax=unclassified Kitasatospora TaxID=2633591 RepID=UPI0033DC3549
MSTQPPTNTWLYAIADAGCTPPPGLTGVAGETLRAIAAPDLTALAGSVPRGDFDEEPLRAHLADAAWLEHAVRAHHRVVDTLARTAPMLPLRFATLYRDDRRAAAMLERHHDELLASLGHVTGRVEWGVKAYAGLAGPTPDAAAESGDTRQDPAARPGTAYLLRRQAQHHRREQDQQQAADDAQDVHTVLAQAAAEATRHPLQRPETVGRTEPMVLNGAYLVEQARTAAFHAAVDALSARFPGLRLETTGPWPPYSFTAAVQPGDEQR